MLLDRIDIDIHGPLRSVELGPFSEHLNVVTAPGGSGKTALVRFIRDSLVERDYPLGMLSSSAGRVVWADRHGLVHCRRETDGTPTGRRSVQWEHRGLTDHPLSASLATGAMPWRSSTSTRDGVEPIAVEAMAMQTVKLSPSLADGIITDTAITHVGRVVASAIAAGLDDRALHRDLPLHHDSMTSAYRDLDGPGLDHASARLRAELADIDAELASLPGPVRHREHQPSDDRPLRERRRRIIEEIQRINLEPVIDPHTDGSRLRELHVRCFDLRVQRDAILRWLRSTETRFDSTVATPTDEAWRYRTELANGGWGDRDLSRSIESLDVQIVALERVASALTRLTETIEQADRMSTPPWRSPWDAAAIAADRYRSFLGAIDRYDRPRWEAVDIDRYWNRHEFYSTTGDPRRGETHAVIDASLIDARIEQAQRQIDAAASVLDPNTVSRLTSVRNDIEQIRRGRHVSSVGIDSGSRIANQLKDDRAAIDSWVASRRDQRRDALSRERFVDVDVRQWDFGFDRYAVAQERGRAIEDLRRIENELTQAMNDAVALRRSLRYLPVANGFFDSDFVSGEYATGFGHARPAFDETSFRSFASLEEDASSWPRGGELVQRQRRLAWLRQELSDLNRRISEGESHFGSRQSDSLAAWQTGRVAELRRRRDEILRSMPTTRAVTPDRHPLAEIASRWLVRLSGGVSRQINWRNSSPIEATRHPVAVTIDGRDETACDDGQRALASIAVRMAAATVLSDLGRPVPLVLELHPATLAAASGRSAYADRGRIGRVNDALAAALRDYAGGGHDGSARQIIVLSEDASLAGQLRRVGARGFQVEVRRREANHRPMWRPQYEEAHYDGVHRRGEAGPLDHYPAATRFDGGDRPLADHPIRTHEDINRALDVASAYSNAAASAYSNAAASAYSNAAASDDSYAAGDRPNTRTDWAMPAAGRRDGYYYADQSTTDGRHEADSVLNAGGVRLVTPVDAPEVDIRPVSPYFLSVDSPIDQAPSIDAVAAARLRACKVTHVTHLMSRDANRLADSLGLTHVDANTIRHWQSECRLVTQVPQLRGFDARVLVGCGITTPSQLAAIHPTDLLRDVEAFLATHRGQQILLSGSSHELSRLTSWIAAANAGMNVDRDFDHERYEVAAKRRESSKRRVRRRRYRIDADGNRYEIDATTHDRDIEDETRLYDDGRDATERDRSDRYDANRRGGNRRRARSFTDDSARVVSSTRNPIETESQRLRTVRRDDSELANRDSGGRRSDDGSNDRSSSRSSRRSSRSSYASNGTFYTDGNRSGVSDERSDRSRSRRSSERSGERSSRRRSERETQRVYRDRDSDRSSQQRSTSHHESESQWRFYLNRRDPVVDAPSIGPRMAARLERIGISTVDDLLTTDAETIADGLDHRRIDAETVLAWQQQTTLVCRVPMLRGHDAQLLVAAEVTTPEELAEQEAESLFPLIDAVANSSEGKRIVRGGKLPDMEEVTEWISYAGHHRQLNAA